MTNHERPEVREAAERYTRLCHNASLSLVYDSHADASLDTMILAAEYLSIRDELRTLREQTRWIPMVEMPDKGVRVLVLLNGTPYVALVSLTADAWYCAEMCCFVSPSHWQPLPSHKGKQNE